MAGLDLMGRLFAMTRNRDGQARSLMPSGLGEAPDPAPRSLSDPERDLQDVIAAKVLSGWLSNRQQTLVPHTLNFAVLSPDQAELLVAVMAATAQADGRADPTETQRVPLALRRLGAGGRLAEQFEAALRVPQPLSSLVAQVEEAGLATHAYAAALLAIERRNRSNRAFLQYLSARLNLSPDVASSLERRYRT